MSPATTELISQQVLEAAEDSDIVHLTCCRDNGRVQVALCGWICDEPASDDDEFECVVCVDIANGFSSDECVRGGRCPS